LILAVPLNWRTVESRARRHIGRAVPTGPYNPAVDAQDLSALPGAELVLSGLRDIEQGDESIAALLVLVGAPRLRSLGLAVPAGDSAMSPEHRLYARLRAENAPTAHSRYNALVRRLVSFERALACASG
jgi:hypothetical protein